MTDNELLQAISSAIQAQIEPLKANMSKLDAKLDITKQELKGEINATKQALKDEIDATKQELKGEIDATKQELKSEIDATKQELKGEIDATKQELKGEIDATKQELKGEIDATKQNLITRMDTMEHGILNTCLGYTDDQDVSIVQKLDNLQSTVNTAAKLKTIDNDIYNLVNKRIDELTARVDKLQKIS